MVHRKQPSGAQLHLNFLKNVFFIEKNNLMKSQIPKESNNRLKKHLGKIFFYIVDKTLVQLRSRFEQLQHFESIFGFLFDGSKLISFVDDELKKCCLNLESNLTNGEESDIDGKDLFLELQIFQKMLPDEAYKGESPWTSIQIMEFAKRMDMFPNVLVAYKILLTIPVTVASAERSFSKLKLLKTYLRSTMTQERLNGLALLSIERQFLESLDCRKIIEVFASKNARRHRFR